MIGIIINSGFLRLKINEIEWEMISAFVNDANITATTALEVYAEFLSQSGLKEKKIRNNAKKL